jgi:hypothetical protein
LRKSSSDPFIGIAKRTSKSPPHLRVKRAHQDNPCPCLLRMNIRLPARSARRWNDAQRACVRRRGSNLRIEIWRADNPLGPTQLVARRVTLAARRVSPARCTRRLRARRLRRRPVRTRLQALTRRARLRICRIWLRSRGRRRLRRCCHHAAHQAQKGGELNMSRHDDPPAVQETNRFRPRCVPPPVGRTFVAAIADA